MVYIDQHTNRKIALRQFEKQETRFLTENIKASDVCLDIGANIGYYSLLFATKGKKVVAIEPVIENVALLNLTSVLNPDLSISVLHAAVSDNCGTAEFNIAEQTSLSGLKTDTSYVGFKINEYKTRLINTLTIDSLNLDKLDIVKIDVEGAELLVLLGMKDTLFRLKPRIVFIELVDEHLDRYHTCIKDVLDFMKNIGYTPKQLENLILVDHIDKQPINDNYFFTMDS